MKFITDKEQVKAGFVIFRRGDVGHDQYYCRVRIQNEDHYKTISLKTSDWQTALDDALEHYANTNAEVRDLTSRRATPPSYLSEAVKYAKGIGLIGCALTV